MAPKVKYYAVRAGRQPGVYLSWEKCKEQVERFPGAEYKAFPSEQEARAYLSGRPPVGVKTAGTAATPSADGYDIYVDGTFRKEDNRYGWAFVVYRGGEIIFTDCGAGENDAAAVIHNVAGELSATMRAVKWAHDNGAKPLTIHHDYVGIAAWALGDWKANNKFTQAYAAYIRPYLPWVAFNKVPGHAGVAGNEMADKLAREALGKKTPQ
ncbi:viroplasmin family protein [Anaeroselena agilis]|uniref:ribonuclease H n=1 Tax=Anaeroselena agilis TaxID=3063788 RepID=A0ABU3NY99_9FIRM|nr:ribonuclease H family protein [Selenomonadales bacterium 4137-cl]